MIRETRPSTILQQTGFRLSHLTTDRYRKFLQDKLQQTFQFLNQTKSVELSRVRTKLEKDFDPKQVTPEEFYDTVVSDADFHTAVKVLLGLFEDLSIAVQDEFVHEPTVYKSVCTSLPYMYKTFLPYIQEARKRRGDDRIVRWKSCLTRGIPESILVMAA